MIFGTKCSGGVIVVIHQLLKWWLLEMSICLSGDKTLSKNVLPQGGDGTLSRNVLPRDRTLSRNVFSDDL